MPLTFTCLELYAPNANIFTGLLYFLGFLNMIPLDVKFDQICRYLIIKYNFRTFQENWIALNKKKESGEASNEIRGNCEYHNCRAFCEPKSNPVQPVRTVRCISFYFSQSLKIYNVVNIQGFS